MSDEQQPPPTEQDDQKELVKQSAAWRISPRELAARGELPEEPTKE